MSGGRSTRLPGVRSCRSYCAVFGPAEGAGVVGSVPVAWGTYVAGADDLDLADNLVVGHGMPRRCWRRSGTSVTWVPKPGNLGTPVQ